MQYSVSPAHHVTQRLIERRSAVRREVSLGARLWDSRLGEWLPCMVVNVSPMGALIVTTEPIEVQGEIRLQIPEHMFDVAAAVRHQDGYRIGVEFMTNRREALALFGR